MRTLRRIGLGMAVVVALMVAGCAGEGEPTRTAEPAVELPPLSEVTPLEDPSAYEGPTTARIPTDAVAELKLSDDEITEPTAPRTVTSYARSGETVVSIDRAERVLALSLSGSVAEYVHALGHSDLLVGRDVSTGIPELADLPVVTRDGHSIDAEAVLSLSPDLIITDGSIGPTDVVEQLADAGVAVVFVHAASTFAESYTQAQEVADALGVSESAAPLLERLQAAVAQKEAEIQALLPADPDRLPRVAFLYMRGEGIFFLFGSGSGVDSLFDSLGVVDVAEEIGWEGSQPMNDEALVDANPDTILVMTGGLESVGGVDGMMTAHPSVALTDAGKKQRIIDVADTSLFAGGVRIPDTLDGLARALYAPDSLAP